MACKTFTYEIASLMWEVEGNTETLNETLIQGTHCTRKTGKMDQKKSLSGKTQEIRKFCQNTGKTQGIWFAQVVNSKDILKFAAKISNFLLKT